MEIVSSVIDTIKQRLRNPFIFSFIVGWLTYNWQITMSFIWFKSAEVDIVQLIRKTATGWDSFWIPIAIATFYTFVVPYISIGIEMFNATIVKWNNNRVFKISKDSYVSFEKYYKLRDNYKKKEDRLAEMIETEEKREQLHNEREQKLIENQRLILDKDSEMNDLRNEISEQKDELKVLIDSEKESTVKFNQLSSVIAASTDIKTFLGSWKGTLSNYSDLEIFEDSIKINGLFYYVANINNGVAGLSFTLIPKERIDRLEFIPLYCSFNEVKNDKLEGFINGIPILFTKSRQKITLNLANINQRAKRKF